jgi:hypothetical protein
MAPSRYGEYEYSYWFDYFLSSKRHKLMAQCEKKLANGEQCSNQAIPGASYCQMHMRIIFRPATGKERADTAPSPEPGKQDQKGSQSGSKQRDWRASPSAVGQKPVFPSLLVDEERNILVAPQGIIWLQAEPADTPTSRFSRLVRLLGLLSQSFPLPGQLTVFSQAQGENYILRLTPIQTQTAQFSIFYDKASDAARQVNGRFYVGQNRAFVQYRDDGAPRGYDVPDFVTLGHGNELFLVAHWGSRTFSETVFTEISLYGLCLNITPSPGGADQAPELIYALVPPPLYPPLAKYFRAHHLRYRIAYLHAAPGTLVLFEIRPRPDAPVGQVVPSFILDYLSRLPRVALLVAAYQAGDLSILLQWKHRYPLHLPHVANAFASNKMILLMASYYPNLFINPLPQFFDGDQLVDIQLPHPQVIHLEQLPANALTFPKLEVLLRSDPGPTPPIAALILSPQEMVWLRQLLYLLDGEAFRDYMLCQGKDLTILIGNDRPIEGLPFGRPLRRPGNRVLFIPLRSRFVPDIPWPLLQEALTLQEQVYTFLTPEYRLDLSEELFVPLSRILVADSKRPRVNIDLVIPPTLPTLTWIPQSEPSEATPADKTKKEKSFRERILPKLPAPSSEGVVRAPRNKVDESALWREKARACEELKDYLSAAVCYNFLNDLSNSARCYHLAAIQLKTQERAGE